MLASPTAFLSTLSLLVLTASTAAAQATPAKAKVSTRVYLSANKLTAGQQVPFAIRATISEGWHVNAQPASQEFLIPISVKVYSKQGTKLAEMLYPKGHIEQSAIGELNIYEDEVMMFGKLDVPAGLVGAKEELIFETSYQACSSGNQCLPPSKVKITGKIDVVAPGTPIKAMNASVFAKQAKIRLTGTVIKPTATR